MQNRINLKPAEEVMKKEGDFFAKDILESSIEDVYDNELLEIEEPSANEMSEVNELSLVDTAENESGIEIPLPTTTEEKPVDKVQEEKMISLNEVSLSTEQRRNMPIRKKRSDAGVKPESKQNVVAADFKDVKPLNQNKPKITHIERVTSSAGKSNLNNIEDIPTSDFNLGVKNSKSEDNSVLIDLMRTNVYYSKKMCEEVSELKSALNKQAYIKMFTTFIFLGISLYSLYYGFKMASSLMENGLGGISPILDMVNGGNLSGDFMGQIMNMFQGQSSNTAPINEIVNGGVESMSNASVATSTTEVQLDQNMLNSIMKSVLK